MIRLEPPLRVASEADAKALADLVNFAGEGLPLYIWEGLAKDGQDPWDVGRARQMQRVREGQVVVVDFGDGAVASLTGYPIGSEPSQLPMISLPCSGRCKNWKTRHSTAGMSMYWPAIPSTAGKGLAHACSVWQKR